MVGVFWLAGWLAAVPTQQRAFVDLEVRGRYDYQPRDSNLQGARLAINRKYHLGIATVSVTIYLRRPVVDDDAPLSLQPFLQRLTALRLSAEAGATETSYGFGIQSTGMSALIREQQFRARVDGYVHRNVVLIGSVGMRAWQDPVRNSPPNQWFGVPLRLGLGLHVRDNRIDLEYGVSPWNDADGWRLATWGQVLLSGRFVVKRVAMLRVGATVADTEAPDYFTPGTPGGPGMPVAGQHGIAGGFSAGVSGSPRRWLDLHVDVSWLRWLSGAQVYGVFAEGEGILQSSGYQPVPTNRISFSLGVTLWWSRFVATEIDYVSALYSTPERPNTHGFILAVRVRPWVN